MLRVLLCRPSRFRLCPISLLATWLTHTGPARRVGVGRAAKFTTKRATRGESFVLSFCCCDLPASFAVAVALSDQKWHRPLQCSRVFGLASCFVRRSAMLTSCLGSVVGCCNAGRRMPRWPRPLLPTNVRCVARLLASCVPAKPRDVFGACCASALLSRCSCMYQRLFAFALARVCCSDLTPLQFHYYSGILYLIVGQGMARPT